MSQAVDPSHLGPALRSARRQQRLSLRDLAAEIDVSFNTLSRVERGFVPDLTNYTRITRWLEGVNGAAGVRPNHPSTPNIIARHLMADPRLPLEAAEAIALAVQEMYSKLTAPAPTYAVHMRSAGMFLPSASEALAAIIRDMHSSLANEQP